MARQVLSGKEVLTAINAYLLQRITLTCGTAINDDWFTGDTDEEVMTSHDPGPTVTKRYMNESFEGEFNFSYYCKSTNAPKARQHLEAIQEVLFLDNFQNLFGFSRGRLVPVTNPTRVSRDDNGVAIYTSSYRLDFYKEGAS